LQLKRFRLLVAMLPSVVSPFVCLFHVRALCSNGTRYRHDFFCIRLVINIHTRSLIRTKRF